MVVDMKQAVFLAGLTLTVAIIDLTVAFPSGAPDRSCHSMKPKHRVSRGSETLFQPQTGIPASGIPYRIHMNTSEDVAAGEIVQVTITALDGNHNFLGFLLEAHDRDANVSSGDVSDNRHGQFVNAAPGSKLICEDEGVTHSEHRNYTEISLYWAAPSYRTRTSIHFTATVVQAFSTYFMDLRSPEIWVKAAGQGDTAADVKPLTAGLLFVVAMATVLLSRD